MATHSIILVWKIPWTEESGGLHNPWGRKESDTTEHALTHTNRLQSTGIRLLPVYLEVRNEGKERITD